MKPARLSWMFWLRLAIVSLGLLIASGGLYAWRNGNLWFFAFNPRFGTWGTGPTLAFVFFGLLIVLFGLSQKDGNRFPQKSKKRWTAVAERAAGSQRMTSTGLCEPLYE